MTDYCPTCGKLWPEKHAIFLPANMTITSMNEIYPVFPKKTTPIRGGSQVIEKSGSYLPEFHDDGTVSFKLLEATEEKSGK